MNDSTIDNERLAALAHCLRSRRSIKLFDDRPVERELLEAAMEVARWAPNHHVTEPWRFYVLGEKSARKMVGLTYDITAELKNEEVARRKADRWAETPAWVAVTCAVADDELRRLEDYAACCCAIQNFSLYLWEAGVGLKWSTGAITRDSRFYELLGVDYAQETVIALMSCGYPKTVPEQRRKDVADFVSWLD